MKKIKFYSLKYIPIIEIKNWKTKKKKPKLTKENQDYIKEISGSGFIRNLIFLLY